MIEIKKDAIIKQRLIFVTLIEIGEMKMFEENGDMYKVEDETVLWKYMSFSKFVNLLLGHLYMNRIDQFEDVFECHFTSITKKVLEESPYSVLSNSEKIGQKTLYVSCFHASEYETAFMWNQYSQQDGIAIRTTAERVKKAFINTKEHIYLSKVKYLDYETDYIDPTNLFKLAIHKRKSFEFEQEVRCVCMKFPNEIKLNVSLYDIETPKGIKVPVDLNLLIDKIYLSPYAPKYLEDNLKALMDKFNLHKEIINSDLYTIK